MGHEVKKGGRPPHQPTDQSRKFVEAMAACGIDQDSIGRVVGISDATLRKHYPEEIATAAIKANAMVGQSLLHQAIGGPEHNWREASTSAAIWWSKTRMGWKEPPQPPQDYTGTMQVVIAKGDFDL
jgi:hypothetical protein